jgi:hypothetical protein
LTGYKPEIYIITTNISLTPVMDNSPTTTLAEETKPARLWMLLSFFAIYVVWGSTYLAIRITVETIPPLVTAG